MIVLTMSIMIGILLCALQKQNEKKDAVKLYGNCYDIDDCRVVINNGCVL